MCTFKCAPVVGAGVWDTLRERKSLTVLSLQSCFYKTVMVTLIEEAASHVCPLPGLRAGLTLEQSKGLKVVNTTQSDASETVFVFVRI